MASSRHEPTEVEDLTDRFGLLERARELSLLQSSIERATASSGTVVLVQGAAGVGKSSLLAAARTLAADAGCATLAARGSELETGLPFGVARQLLPAVALDVGLGSTTDRERHAALLTRVQDELSAAAGHGLPEPTPHLIAVDDAQWADAPSLAYLVHLALRIETLPVILIVGVRTGEGAVGPELELLRRERSAHVLSPRPLSDAAVGLMARSACGEEIGSGLIAACSSATGGNPFYLSELLRDLAALENAPTAEDVAAAAPPSVLRALLARLAALGHDHARLATAIAVLGDRVPLAWAAELAGLAPTDAEAAADALAAADLLAPGEPVALAHPLIGSALRADIGAFARARAHRRAADVLRRAGAPSEQIASQLVPARPDGDPEAVRTLRAAAATAREHGDPPAAIALLRRALAEPPAPEVCAGTLTELARAEAVVGDPAAIGHLEQALELLEDPRSRGEAIAELSQLLHQAGDFEGAAALATRGRAELPAEDPTGARLQAIALGAGVLSPSLHAVAAEEMTALAARAAGGRAPRDPALLALLANHLTYGDGDAELAASLASAAFADDPLVAEHSQGVSLAFALMALIDLDRPAAAGPRLETAATAAASRGAILTLSIVGHLRALLELRAGRLRAALAHAEASLDAYRDRWVETPWAAPTLAWIQIERGDLDAAAEAVALGERAGSTGVAQALMLEGRARLALARGELADALSDATASTTLVQTGYGLVPARGFHGRFLAVGAAHRLGEDGLAAALVDELRGQLDGLDAPHPRGESLVAAAAIAGDHDRPRLLRDAVGAFAEAGSYLAETHALTELAAAQRRVGDRAGARESASQAYERAERMGAQPLVDRVRTQLWSLGLRPRRGARSGAGSLTPSEGRVAALAATGLSTSEIARELYITRKTVESHLSRIYRKLDIRGRGQLATSLARIADD